MTLRYNGLCLRCSGDASDFYVSESGSYKFVGDHCPSLVTKCAAVFAAKAEAQKVYMQLVKVALAEDAENEDAATIESIEPSNDQIDSWYECASDIEACEADDEMVSSLCQDISISKPDPQLGEEPSVFEVGADTFDGAEISSARLLAMLKRNRRALQESTDDGNGYVLIDAEGGVSIEDIDSGEEEVTVDEEAVEEVEEEASATTGTDSASASASDSEVEDDEDSSKIATIAIMMLSAIIVF